MTEFPVTNSTLSANKLGELLQHKYSLSENTECKLFRTGMNHVYMVTDSNEKYVFRIYTFDWRTKKEIVEELRLLIHLNKNNTPVSFPIVDNLNEYIQEINAPEGKRFGVLFSFADGTKSAKFTPETSFYIGEALAKVHQSTENFTLSRITYDNTVLLIDSIKRTREFFKKESDEILFLEKTANFLQKEFNNVQKDQIRNGAVHLDVWFDNIHFNTENKVTLFDFDFCGNGWLCLDISYFLFQLYYTNLNDNDYQIKAESFLKGYETITKISEEERRILPFACLAIMTYYISIQCDRYDNWTNIFLNEDHLKRFVGNLKRWIAYNKIQIE
ncbi:phosphotransferase [Flavobacterium granuli]|uniref:Ser/Thr protein kinase RdoA (MazF antagonist) n=1 Tax=Flavobacterium granuli TaxID=280093 RepID=A0ABU1S4S4_9FLAO|nr:phosphotransferase [Flavobacterium granuli]MDR6846037.1 Ser/Thr protein kinase RdoA (MazF antagonist) [Flavobacterium granuli]